MLRIAVGTRLGKDGQATLRRRDVGLGSFPEVSLAEARERARELRKFAAAPGADLHGRPTKRDRRRMDRFGDH